MLHTYEATINGSLLEWKNEVPEEVKNSGALSVIVTILEEQPVSKDLRPFGLSKDLFSVPEDFDAPLTEEVLADFEN